VTTIQTTFPTNQKMRRCCGRRSCFHRGFRRLRSRALRCSWGRRHNWAECAMEEASSEADSAVCTGVGLSGACTAVDSLAVYKKAAKSHEYH
jgi:hypothetical protein